MMLDIRKNVFVVRVGAGKSCVVDMWLSVIPGYFVHIAPQLIPVIFDYNRPFVK